MALIKCPECGKEVSELSESCIGCGYPISKFLAKQKIDKEILSVDVQNDCKAIRCIFTEFRNSYVPLSGMKININDIREIVKLFNAKINLLNIEAQKEIRGKFAESFCIGLCENTNLDVLNFNDVKSMCDIINISNISEQSMSNIVKTIYEYSESVEGTASIMPLSWIFGWILKTGSDTDKALIESTLQKPNAFGVARKVDVLEVLSQLENTSVNNNTISNNKVEEFVPKCPTCQSIDIKKVSVTSKAGSVFMWGLLSQKVKKQWHCNNCGYEW